MITILKLYSILKTIIPITLLLIAGIWAAMGLPIVNIGAIYLSNKLQKEKAFDNKELVLKKDLSAEEIARFNVRSFNFQHAFIAQRYRRISDYPEIFSHVFF